MKSVFFSALSILYSLSSFSQAGAPLTSFGSGGSANTVVGSGSTTVDMAIQSDAKIIVAGYATVGGNSDFALARYKTDGTLDLTFNGTGKLSTAIGTASDYLNAITIQNDGKILAVGYCVVGSFYNIGVARYLPDGTLDAGFSGDGKLTFAFGASASTVGMDVAVQSDGKIVVVGSYNNDIVVLRYNADGTPDASFDLDGIVSTSFSPYPPQVTSVLLQSDGKILVGGSSQNQFALVRYNTDGSLDTSFDGDGKLTTTINASGSSRVNSLAIQNDGSIIAAGRYSYYDFMTDMNANNVAIAKYSSSGVLQTSFDGDGKLTFAINTSSFTIMDEAKSVAVQSDGKILVTGTGFSAVRLNAAGSFDNTFDGDGKVTGADGVAVKLWSNRVYIANLSGGLGLRAFQNDFTVLPVRLVAFNAVRKEKAIELTWHTAAEGATKAFQIERSSNGLQFTAVGEVKAAGTSLGADYRFLDRTPLEGKNVYRLKIVDEDRTFSYSKVLSVYGEKEAGLVLLSNAVNGLKVRLNGEGAVLLNLVDALGRTHLHESISINGTVTRQLDTRSLPPGQYFLTMQAKDYKETKTFFRQ